MSDIDDQLERAAFEGSMKSIVRQFVETAQAQGYLQDLALDRVKFTASISLAEDIQPHILSGNVTIPELQAWLDEAITEIVQARPGQKEALAQEQPTPLAVPVPPMLEEALGFEGTSRWTGFYWEPAGDEARQNDGHIDEDAEWDGYLAYVRHPSVEPALLPYDLGSSESPARHWLLLDRVKREVSVARRAVAARVLRRQWFEDEEAGDQHSPEAVQEAMQQVIDALNAETWTASTQTFDTDAMLRKMQQHQEAVTAMLAWLDSQPQGGDKE